MYFGARHIGREFGCVGQSLEHAPPKNTKRKGSTHDVLRYVGVATCEITCTFLNKILKIQCELIRTDKP